MNNINNSEKFRRIHFAVMAIEGSAKKLNISGDKMYNRLKDRKSVV